MARPPGILPSGCAGGLRGFPTAHPCTGGKLARIHAGHPADFPPPARRAIGAPEKQRAPARRSKAQTHRGHRTKVHIPHFEVTTLINFVSCGMHCNPAPSLERGDWASHCLHTEFPCLT